MRIIQEIGWRKSVRFLLYIPISFFYKFMFISQLRVLLLKILGSRIDKYSIIMAVNFFNWHHKGPNGIKIGKDCFIADEVLIDLYDKVILENQVTLAQRVTILTHLNVGYKNHPLQKYFPKFSKPVIFKKGCVIGAASTILPGVTIGEQSFVAAGSVVTKNIPSKSLAAGVPARVISKIK